jgi:hypothetical protein
LTLLHGLGAAGIAGLLVLGPGLRLAMRVVALQDPFRSTEFSFPGTVFILLFLGLMVGVPLGVVGAVVSRFLPRLGAIVLMSAVGMAMIMADSEIMNEFLELGAGPVVNFSMFTSVFLLYAYVDLRLLARFDREVASGNIEDTQEARV